MRADTLSSFDPRGQVETRSELPQRSAGWADGLRMRSSNTQGVWQTENFVFHKSANKQSEKYTGFYTVLEAEILQYYYNTLKK